MVGLTLIISRLASLRGGKGHLHLLEAPTATVWRHWERGVSWCQESNRPFDAHSVPGVGQLQILQHPSTPHCSAAGDLQPPYTAGQQQFLLCFMCNPIPRAWFIYFVLTVVVAKSYCGVMCWSESRWIFFLDVLLIKFYSLYVEPFSLSQPQMVSPIMLSNSLTNFGLWRYPLAFKFPSGTLTPQTSHSSFSLFCSVPQKQTCNPIWYNLLPRFAVSVCNVQYCKIFT